jgi:hypothetical protein
VHIFQAEFLELAAWSSHSMLSFTGWLKRSVQAISKARRANRDGLGLIENLESRQLLTQIFGENFEGAFANGVNGWAVNSSTGRNWDDSDDASHTGLWSGYSADLVAGTDQTSYLNNLDTTFTRTVDLSDYRGVSLSYWRRLQTEPNFDTFQVTVSKAGVGSVSSTALSGNVLTWAQDTLAIPESLWGQSGVTVQFKFHSDASVVPAAPSGVWVDDISMDGFNDPGFPESTITVPSGTNLRLNQFGEISNVAGSIGSAGEIDTFGFGVDAPGNYTITVAGSAGLDAQLRVYDASGNAITGIIDSTASNGTETITVNRPVSGEGCYFRVGGFTSSTGSYAVSVSGPNSIVASESVPSPAYSTSDTGSIDFAGDRDYYSFTAPLDTTLLSITLNNSAGLDGYLTLLNSAGTVLATRDTGVSGQPENLTSFGITAGQTYILMVSGYSVTEGSSGSESYDFTIDFNPDNVGNPPSVITVPTGANLRLNQFGDISNVASNIASTFDFKTFGFGVETTGSYTITAGGAGSVDTQLRVYDASGNAITAIQDLSLGGGTESVNVNLTAGQTCYFAVGGFSTLPGAFTVGVNGPSATPSTTTFAAPNYFLADTAAINNAGDRDYFGVTAPAATNALSIVMSPSAGLDGVIFLFDATGNLLQQRDVLGTGGTETIASFGVVAGQSYVVMFSGFSIAEGSAVSESYNYSLDFGPDLSDPNVAPTVPSGQDLPILENSAIGTVVGTVVANDANSTAPNNVLSYQILTQSPSTQFSINASTGAITYVGPGPLNFEGTADYTLSVKVTDGGGLSATQNVIVSIADVNETPAIPVGQVLQVLENSAVNTVVGAVSATDPDTVAPNSTLTYSILSGNPSNPFSINPATGQVTVANPAVLNFETTPQFTLQVKVTDGGAGNLNATQSVVVNLMDANDPPSIAAGQAFSLPENSGFGSPVGTVVATDPDTTAPNKTLSYSITSGNTNTAFAISPNTGAITVNNAAAVDFEATPSFTLTITVTDGGALEVSQDVIVNLTNVNEPPTVAPGQTFSVPENSAVGTVVNTVAASDPDADKTLTFGITSGNTNNAFAINAATGAITVNTTAALDFEVTPSFNLTVTATDGGGLSASQTVVVNLTNVNEAPSLGAPGASPTFVFKHKTPVNVFPLITVIDPDGVTDLATVTISVSVPNGKRKFDVISSSGTAALGAVTGSFASGNLMITLNAGVTTGQVESFLRSIKFSTKGASLKTLTRNFQVSVTDKSLAVSNLVTQTVNVKRR